MGNIDQVNALFNPSPGSEGDTHTFSTAFRTGRLPEIMRSRRFDVYNVVTFPDSQR